MEEFKIQKITEDTTYNILKIYIDTGDIVYTPIISLPLYFVCEYERARLLDLHIWDKEPRYKKLYADKPKKDILIQCLDYMEKRIRESKAMLAQVKE